MNIRMSTKGKRPLRSLTPSDKIHAIQRIHDGESKASVARDIGVPESTLRGWCKNEDKLRFMSRQSVSDKMAAETLSDKMDGAGGMLGGPPEKRQKMDASMPLNFSNKIKFDELAYKRAPLNGLDFSTNKALSEFGSFNGLAPDYAAFNGAVKNKMFGADIARQGQNDPSLAAISPLTSLSHLSGLTGIGHSPLAISFNELTSNLSLLAQLNPGLAAMSGLNGLAANNNALRNIKPKSNPAPLHSPRSDRGCSGGSGNSNGGERQGLSVRNWAKQKPPTPTSSLESNTGLNLSQPELKNKMKCPSPSLAPSLGNNMPAMPTLTDDPLLYWLKSQQAMLGLNNLYPQTNFDVTSPPIRSSTPQQQSQQANTPPVSSTPLTPSSTPSGSLDDKNSAWFNWCKAFGASISSLAPAAAAAAMQAHPLNQVPTSSTHDGPNGDLNEQQNGCDQKPYENILYSHLTKDTDSNSIKSFSTVDNINSNEVTSNTGKPEDLSAKTTKSISPAPSPLPTPAQSPDQSQTHSLNTSRTQSPIQQSEDTDTLTPMNNRNSVAKDVLDDILYKINKNAPNNTFECRNMRESMEGGSDSNNSYNSTDSNHNHNNLCENNNNNNNSNKTDEEERMKREKYNMDEEEDGEEAEAIRHGEKFLKWLENCSNPRVTTVQLMQLRFLITAVKTNSESSKTIHADVQSANSTTDEIYEDGSRSKGRRRK